MAHPIELKNKAIALRKRGYSLKEVSEILNISKSTASEWLSFIELDEYARKRLVSKQMLGQYKTVLIKRERREKEMKLLLEIALTDIKKVAFSKELLRLFCSLLWWCEGNKDTSMVRFTSSDETLVSNFLYLLRSGFSLDESKFRALVHIHSYHNDLKQRSFWSKITKIPLSQFHTSFQKPNTAKRKKEGYAGCVAISYYDARIAKELTALYNAFTLIRGVR